MLLKSYFGSRLIANQGPDFSPEDSIANVARLVHVENHDRDLVVHAKAEGGRIHDLQPFRERFSEREAIVEFRVRVSIWVSIIYAGDFCGFQDDVGANLARPQRRGRVGRKIRITCAGGENNNATKFEMADGAAQNEGLGHVFHFDGRLNTRFNPHLSERAA